MTVLKLTLILVALLGFFVACDQSFNPKGVYDERMVVVSVLVAERDTQYARVYLTYDPPAYDPNVVTVDNAITNALVTMTGAPAFRDTTIQRLDKSRYTSEIHAYVAHPFRVSPAATYALDVTAASIGSAAAGVTVPGKGSILNVSAFVIDRPDTYLQDINFQLRISPVTQGYLMRMIIEYERTVGGITVVGYEEVPQSIQTIDGVVYLSFPKLTRRVSVAGPTAENRESVFFSRLAYKYSIDKLRVFYQNQQLKFKVVLMVMTQVEPNLYKYYNIVNGFQDENSIRTDQPDFTNIQGGVGVFGAMTMDSTIQILPADF